MYMYMWGWVGIMYFKTGNFPDMGKFYNIKWSQKPCMKAAVMTSFRITECYRMLQNQMAFLCHQSQLNPNQLAFIANSPFEFLLYLQMTDQEISQVC